MPYQLPDDAVMQGYRQNPHCFETCLICREQIFHSPSKNFTGTEEEFFEAGHAYRYIVLKNGLRDITVSQKVLRDAGLLEPVSDKFTPWPSRR
jgi:hypothetical protein